MSKEYEIAFKLGADLESTFSKSFLEATGSFQKLEKQVQHLQQPKGKWDLFHPFRQDLKKTRDEMTKTEKVADALNGVLVKFGGIAGGVFAVTSVVGFAKDSATLFTDFEQGMANVQAISGATSDELFQLTEVAKDLGASTTFSAKEAAEGMQYMALAGFDSTEIISAMPGLLDLAAAANMDLAQASDIVTDTMSAFGLSAEQATQAADIFARTQSRSNTDVYQLGEAMKYAGSAANAAGMSLEQTSAVLGVLADSGIKGSMAGTTFNAMLRDLKKSAEDGAIAIGEQTIALYNQDGTMRDLGNVMADIEQATAGMTTQQKDAALSFIFGDEAMRGANIMLQTGTKRYFELEDAIYNSTGAAKEMADIQNNTVRGSLEELSGAIETAKIELGEKMAPAIRFVADNVAKWIPKAIDTFERAMAKIAPIVTAAKNVISNVAGVLSNLIIPGITAAFEMLAPRVQSVFSKVQDAVTATWSVISLVIDALVAGFNWAFPVIQEVVSATINGIAVYIDGVLTVFGGVLDFITGIFTGSWEKAWQGVIDIFGGIFGTLGKILVGPLNLVIELINMAIRQINKVSVTVPDWVPGVGGETYGANISEIPMIPVGGYATGGFVTSPELAWVGEGGDTEAIIPINNSQRSVGLWERAGQMLGIGGRREGFYITYSPQVNVRGGGPEVGPSVERALIAGNNDLEQRLKAIAAQRARLAYE